MNYCFPTQKQDGLVSFSYRPNLYIFTESSCFVYNINYLYDVTGGDKLVFLNTTIRGYPLGIRVGKDPRSPSLTLDSGFNQLTFCGIPYMLANIEVWGCSSPKSR